MNSVALSRPTITAGRRRPSRVPNLAAQIPEENRFNAKDLEMAEELHQSEASKRPQSLMGGGGGALSQGEAWIVAQLAAMEQSFMDRLQQLEEENGRLRQALESAGMTVAPAPVAAKSTYTARFAQAQQQQQVADGAAREPPAKVSVVMAPVVKAVVAAKVFESVAHKAAVPESSSPRNGAFPALRPLESQTSGRKPPAPPAATAPSALAAAAAVVAPPAAPAVVAAPVVAVKPPPPPAKLAPLPPAAPENPKDDDDDHHDNDEDDDDDDGVDML